MVHQIFRSLRQLPVRIEDLTQRPLFGERMGVRRAGLCLVQQTVVPVDVAAADRDGPRCHAMENAQDALSVLLREGTHIEHHVRSQTLELFAEIGQAGPLTVEVPDDGRQVGFRATAMEDRHLVPQRHQTLNHIRADEARAAQDQNPHGLPSSGPMLPVYPPVMVSSPALRRSCRIRATVRAWRGASARFCRSWGSFCMS